MRGAAVSPGERTGGFSLRLLIDRHRAMGRAAAEKIADLTVGRVTTCSRIDEITLAERGTVDAEKVSMAVTGAGVAAERAGIEDQRMRRFIPAATHRHEATYREHLCCCRSRRMLLELLEDFVRFCPEQPKRVRSKASSGPGVRRIAKDDRCGRECCPIIVGRSVAQRHDHPAIRVSNVGHRSIGLTQSDEDVE